MAWKQHLAPLALAVMAVLALALPAHAQTQGQVYVLPNALSTVISPNVENFTLVVVFTANSTISIPYVYADFNGQNWSAPVTNVYFFGNGTYEATAYLGLPTPSKPGIYNGTVYVVENVTHAYLYPNGTVESVENLTLVWSANFTVNAVPLDIVNYSWYTVPWSGQKCITPGSTFWLVVPVYFNPIPASGYVWLNWTLQGYYGREEFLTGPFQSGYILYAEVLAPNEPGNYSGVAFLGNYTTTYEIHWWVVVDTSNCTPPSQAPSQPQVPLLLIILLVVLAVVAIATALIITHRKKNESEVEVGI